MFLVYRIRMLFISYFSKFILRLKQESLKDFRVKRNIYNKNIVNYLDYKYLS